jgi:phosphoserine phosphatase RsbU/P
MTFKRKDRKGQSGHFRFTLALRVISVSLLLLIIPLVFHLMWMYRHDYTNRKKDLFLSLNILGESRASLVDQIISSKIDFLELTNDNPIFFEPIQNNQQNDALNRFFQIAANELEVSEVFYISYDNDEFNCLASSSFELLNKSFANYSFITELLGQKRFSLFGVLPFVFEKRLIVGNTIFSRETNEPIGIFFTAIPAIALAHRLSAIEDSPYVIDLSLLMDEDIIFASSDPNLALRSTKSLDESFIQKLRDSGQIGNLKIYTNELELDPIKDLDDAFQLIGKEKNFAVISPVKNTKISVILDVSENRFFSLQQKEYLIEVIVLLMLIFLIGGVGAFLLIRRFSKPYYDLQNSMEKVTNGDYSARYQSDKMGFEINVIGSNFNYMIESIIKHEKKAQEEKLAKELLENELKIGYDIQMSMLPSKLPELPGLDIATGFIPAKEVGGDFYDLFVLSDGKLVIAIADAAGKGISACLYSLNLRSMLRSFCTSCKSLHEIIRKTNELFMKDTQDTGIFVTLWLGIFDPKTDLLQYSNMGHHHPFVKRENKLFNLKATGIALGVIPLDDFEVNEAKLESKDQLILFTDGVIDAQNKESKFFKEEQLIQVLEKTTGSSQDFIDSIMQNINEFRSNTDLPDDLTIVALKLL